MGGPDSTPSAAFYLSVEGEEGAGLLSDFDSDLGWDLDSDLDSDFDSDFDSDLESDFDSDFDSDFSPLDAGTLPFLP